MKILVTGASGQLGRALRPVLEPRHDVLWTGHEDLDVRDLSALRALTSQEQPEAILHLAAVAQVDACETHPEGAAEVNALGSRYVAIAAREVDAELLLVSTDYVFDGESTRPYAEYDQTHPINVYGRSKLHGERATTSIWGRHYIVRTSGLFGPGGVNFVETIRSLHARDGRVSVVTDQVCRPTYAGDLATAIGHVLGSGAYGTFHISSAGATSWYDLARAVLEECGANPNDVRPTTTRELGRPAPRPAYSVLDTRAFELTFGHVLPHWRNGLRKVISRSSEP